MATKTKSEMIETVRKLAALAAEESGAFKSEIGIASAKIQELMDKYAITWEEVHGAEADRQSKEFEKAFQAQAADFQHNRVQKWHWDLARLIAAATHTRHYLSGSHMAFFGTQENRVAAAMLFDTWLHAIASMADTELTHYRREMIRKHGDKPNFFSSLPEEESCKYYRNSWIDGCISGMHKNVRTQEKERKPEVSSALVLYKADVDKQYEVFSKGFRSVVTHGSNGHNSTAYQRGIAAGSNISVTAKPIAVGKNLPKGK